MKNVTKFLFWLSFFIVMWFLYSANTYALNVQQAIAQAQQAAANRPWAVVHWFNATTWEVTWGCSNGSVRWRIPVLPSAPDTDTDSPEDPQRPWVTSIWWTCSTYISSYSPSWSDCAISSSWSANATITCVQTHSWEPITTACWQWETPFDEEWNGLPSTCNTSSCLANVSPPAPIPNNPATLAIGTPITWTNNAYANNSDTNDVQIPIAATWILWWASVTWWDNPLYWSPGNITELWASWWKVAANRITFEWESALNFDSITHTNVSWWGSSWWFNIVWVKSYAPLFINDGTISFKAWWVSITRNNVSYHFQKPFTSKIEIYDFIKNEWKKSWIQVWTNQQYRLVWINNKNIVISNYKITDFINQILPFDEQNHFIEKKTVSGVTLSNRDGAIFYATINTSSWAHSLWTPGIKIQTPIINYTFGWKQVSYYLNAQEEWDNFAPLVNEESQEFLWVRVIGWIQWAGKSEFTWQKANISNLYNSQMRTEIRKNAYNYVKNMTSGQILNGVKYVKWDITLSWNLTYETLVVVDGNVIINDNLNIDNKVLWIIVLKDNYDVNKDYERAGNIYVTPNVTQINAMIYSDGALISADNTTKKPYLKDTIERTEKLQKQLFMNGSLFTRNTIGWAILAGWNYILPGWVKMAENSSNFEKAMLYDLNYVRRWSDWCDKSTPSNDNCNDNWEYKDPFIIKYDSRIQTKPPKLFSY